MKNIFLLLTVIIVTIACLLSCGEPEALINPTHYNRVPRAVNLTASYDTSAVGNYRIMLNWNVRGSENLKDFEIYRSINNSNFFFLVGGVLTTNYIDSSLKNTSDYSLAYFVNGRGIDRFVGQSSDTVKITATKSF